MTELDLLALDPQTRYKLLTALILLRPVAWVTTISSAGLVNAAPYSFFNLFGKDPALVILGIEHRPDGTPKDTVRNIQQTRVFVVNIATPDLNEAMVATAAPYDPDTSEPETLGLALAPSVHVAAPRLADVLVAIECRHTLTLGFSSERDIIVGEAIGLAAWPGLIDIEKMHVNWDGDFPVARLFADRYAKLTEIERRPIPKLP